MRLGRNYPQLRIVHCLQVYSYKTIMGTLWLEYDRDGNYQYNITRAIARIFEELEHDGISCNKSDTQVIIL